MIVSIHQPAYLPWLGYFEKIMMSDVFVFLDTVQFEKNSFINRNKVKTPQGSLWLTIPVKLEGHLSSTMLETQMVNSQNWQKNHLQSIYMNYKRALRFDKCYPKLEELYKEIHDLLADLCYHHLLFWLRELGIEKRVVRSSALSMTGNKSSLILDLCQYFSATEYLSGALGKDYLQEESFEKAGITVRYQKFNHPQYPQLHGPFVPNMGVVDFWMNTDQFSILSRAPL